MKEKPCLVDDLRMQLCRLDALWEGAPQTGRLRDLLDRLVPCKTASSKANGCGGRKSKLISTANEKGGGKSEKFLIFKVILCHDFPRECRASSRIIAQKKIYFSVVSASSGLIPVLRSEIFSRKTH